MKMKSIAIALSAAGLLSACASTYAGGPFPRYATFDSDGWYDGFYGPYQGGFWGPDSQFYYDDGQHNFHPDLAGHFRHQDGGGFQHIQGQGPLAANTGSHMAAR